MCRLHHTDVVPLVPAPGEYRRGRDHRVSSEIGTILDANGRLPYTIRIKIFMSEPTLRNADGTPAFVDRVPLGNGQFEYTRYNCQPMTEALYASCFDAMVSSVDTYWNDKLFLSHRRDDVTDLSCRIELERVQTSSESNLHITIIHDPHREWRDYCRLGGTPVDSETGEMVLAYPQPGATAGSDHTALNITYENVPTSRGTHTFHQNVFSHELGHYLTLQHTCTHLAGGQTNAGIAYCMGRSVREQDYLMSSGNNLRPNYAYLWRNRLGRHHYHCERSFEYNVVTP